jgi:omega-6 fatty acid desaturase (delta-12 desaturase)
VFLRPTARFEWANRRCLVPHPSANLESPMTTQHHQTPKRDKSWRAAVKPYERPCLRRSLVQMANSFLPYFAIAVAMYFLLSVSFWITLALAPLAAGFLIRIFIISHDCGHGSFFKSRKANNIVGAIGATLTFTPHASWRYQHAIHHASGGNLDHRDVGDVWTMTVKEYLAAPRSKRIAYRIYRNPIVMFLPGSMFQFFISNRFYAASATRKEKMSVIKTNLVLLAILVASHFTIGIKAYLMIQLPIMAFAGVAGVWLFYVQHQFEGVYWEREDEWDYVTAAIEGSSFYRLPKVLQWFSGNIGFHHVHHLSPRIPNYFLEKCHFEQPIFRKVNTITLRTSFKSLSFRLWDEERRQLIGFGDIHKNPA